MSFLYPVKIFSLNVTFILLICFSGLSNTHAQLFGPRSLGTPRSSRSGQASEVGSVSGGERFLRQNRNRRSFVGADSVEGTGFVGSVSAKGAGRIRSSIERLPNTTRNIASVNPPQKARTAGKLYPAPLVVAFEVPATPPQMVQREVEGRLVNLIGNHASEHIEVSLAGRTAILSGLASSEHEKRLAENLLLFEPGISLVENHLQVAPQPSVAP